MSDEKAATEKAPEMTVAQAIEQGLIEAPVWAPQIKAGIEAGDIVEELRFVSVTQKAADGTKTEINEPYVKLVGKTLDGCQWITGKDGQDAIDEVCADFTYGWDLYVRSLVRSKVNTRLEGPDKAIEKAAGDLVKAGAYDNISEAREFVLARRAARGEKAQAPTPEPPAEPPASA